MRVLCPLKLDDKNQEEYSDVVFNSESTLTTLKVRKSKKQFDDIVEDEPII